MTVDGQEIGVVVAEATVVRAAGELVDKWEDEEEVREEAGDG